LGGSPRIRIARIWIDFEKSAMSGSVKIHPDNKPTVLLALERQGFLTQGDLAAHLGIALSTVSNFVNSKAVSISKFEEICETLELDKRAITQPVAPNAHPSTESTLPLITFTAYSQETWVGRTEIITQWREKLRGNCRILLITGITGQGKTALAERLAVELQQEWQYLPPVTFDDETIRDFVSAAEKLLRNLNERVTTEDRKQPDLLLIHHRWWQRCVTLR